MKVQKSDREKGTKFNEKKIILETRHLVNTLATTTYVRIICGTLSWPSCWFAYFIWFVETNCISPKTVWTHSHKTMLKCNVALHIYFLCAYIWCFWRFFFALSLNIATTFPVWFVFHILKPCKIPVFRFSLVRHSFCTIQPSTRHTFE